MASPHARTRTAFIALGSNLGDRERLLAEALRRVTLAGLRVEAASFLYETAPMYNAQQPRFFNAVCRVSSALEPPAMLRALKDVERALGREPSPQRNLPRPIDLDILHVEGVGELRTPELELPHPRIAEREFVLRPLCDIAPDLRVPGLAGTARELLAALPRVDSEGAAQRVFPLRGDLMLPLGSRTLVMAVLNATPDSFSDGDAHESVEQRVERVARLVAAGADLVDVGGQSTRPGAQLVSVEEEMERTLPIIRGVRRAADAAVARVPLSIDTFRAQVAHAALAEGADLVNDVSGGTRDANMLRVVAEARAPIVLMHMRGDAQTMQSATNTAYADLLSDVRAELVARVAGAIDAGVAPWKIALDPGIGFAKQPQQSAQLLRELRSLFRGLPHAVLVGPSRKSFIAHALSQAAGPRIDSSPRAPGRAWGTATAVSAAVAGGADIVRVHDVAEMRAVAAVADAIWRRG